MSAPEITFALTSCNRLDLLARTIDTFRAANRHPIARWILIDDSADPAAHRALRQSYGDTFELILNDTKLGQNRSIDRLYESITTDHLFHCEDDWEFHNERGVDFIAQSLDVLLSDARIGQVWIRDPGDSSHPLEEQIHSTPSGTQYRSLSGDWNGWNGFSWNPGLRRRADYLRCGPFAEQHWEWGAMLHYGRVLGYRAASLLDGYCRHIGDGRHVD